MLEYDGTGFSGWQQQTGRRTVEAELKRSLLELTGYDHKVYAAGRTDAGAHALGQVVSFQLRGTLPFSKLQEALNARLPEDVGVVSAEVVDDEFHARFSARWRRYRYRYLDRPSRPAVDRWQCWHVRRPLDVGEMAAAAAMLKGRHDWSSFCSPGERDPIREMRRLEVVRKDRFVELELEAEGFLRGLARGIAAALAEVGAGRRPASWAAELLEARDRARGPRTAPARGLTLMEVDYE